MAIDPEVIPHSSNKGSRADTDRYPEMGNLWLYWGRSFGSSWVD